MHDIEITTLPVLSPSERSILEMHSILNICGVLRGELALMGMQFADDPEYMVGSLRICDSLVANLHDPVASLADAQRIRAIEEDIFREIEKELDKKPELRDDAEMKESIANLRSVFAIMDVRARELLARAEVKDRWEKFSLAAMKRDFLEVFAAIERNSRGRFHILYNAALQRDSDYYIDFKMESISGDSLWMPPVFKDVMRDVVANARKYTEPGGHIIVALHESDEALSFVVEDTGRGIPAEEIPSVVEFGRRASNVSNVRTMGGGFGLTKALLVTKQFGGRFWIGSQLGLGTRIRIVIPRPAQAGLMGTA
jgi:signal transduction histidine kinase